MIPNFSGNIERFSGFGDVYDQYRPSPPSHLSQILQQLAQIPPDEKPQLVVDLGSGTGLSTRYWSHKASQVIGIEPARDMRIQAEKATQDRNITYQEGFSHETGLPDSCVDIVTCSQSLHWMDPQSTFEEAVRILRSGGVFAAFDYDWPPTTSHWKADAAYIACMKQVKSLEKQLTDQGVRHWEKSDHLKRMQTSGCFSFVNEIVLHYEDQGNAQRLVGLALSQGSTMTLLKNGFSEKDIGIEALKETAQETLKVHPKTWFWSSRLRYGIAP